ncbi:MAG: ABC transporter substrate-binding protein, partial [Caldilineaceae bacterium]|nr:ABC transporter substrate-binding protein [Caldilineaceae bacterium]
MKHYTVRYTTTRANAILRQLGTGSLPGLSRALRLVLLPLLLALTAACAPIAPAPAAPSEPQSPRPITLGVGFIPNVQFAPFYVGIEKGFFAERGIDLSLEYGFENDYLKLVATDELQFLIASGDQLVLGRAQEMPVRYVMNWYTSYPVTVFAKADAGIHEPADLAGRTIGVPGPFGANYIALRALLDVAGLTEADI